MPGISHRTLASFAALVALTATACSRQPAEANTAGQSPSQQRRPSVPVRVAKAVRQDVPLEVRAIGNVEAVAGVAIKSRVAGQMAKVHIRDGQDVRKGDALFEIDPEPFQEAVRLAEANLARDRAQEKQAEANAARDRAQARNARTVADRYAALQKEGVVSRDAADTYRTAAEAAEASLAANTAAIESARALIRADESRLKEARIHLGYTSIRSPIDGRAGAISVKEGNLVKENDTVSLVNILQVRPVYVSFAVPEQALNEIRRFQAGGRLPVEAAPDAAGVRPAQGALDFIDNTVDTTTGTIKLKATFANPDLVLWPGQFVNVVLRLTTEPRRLVVPSSALQTGSRGRYVWVVKQDQTAEMRGIEVDRVQGDLALLRSGVEAGETVIVEGQLRVTMGTKVQASQPGAQQPAAAGGAR